MLGEDTGVDAARNGWVWRWYDEFQEDEFDLLFQNVSSSAGELDLGRVDFDENDLEVTFVYDSEEMLEEKREVSSELESLLEEKYETPEDSWTYFARFASSEGVTSTVLDKPRVYGEVLFDDGVYSEVKDFCDGIVEPPLTRNSYARMFHESAVE